MADDSLKDPVVVRAIGINASSLPHGLNPAYEQYILSQVIDFTNVAGKANEAGQGAYDAQVKNDEQDAELADHELRISQLRVEVDDHEIRITANTSAINGLDIRLTTAEGNIVSLQTDLSNLTTRVSSAETDIDNLQADYVSKTVTTSQSLASPLNVTTSYSVGGTKVIGTRQTGWTAGTGTSLVGSFNANQAYTVSSTYTQTEVSAIATGLQQARQRILALESALRTHGLIN
ncbi:phage tail protein [Pseudocitrobacter faecalis]|uniref:phage tail protein n=1 Tax=Pseudocitrobacter faecalis TaxID=1398493 RepID=UPI00331579AB